MISHFADRTGERTGSHKRPITLQNIEPKSPPLLYSVYLSFACHPFILPFFQITYQKMNLERYLLLTLLIFFAGCDHAGVNSDDYTNRPSNPLASASPKSISSTSSIVIDILPGNDANVLSLENNGRLPVAILSNTEFDASSVDVSTITLGNGEGQDPGVLQRRNNTYFSEMRDTNQDGLLDLVVDFAVEVLVQKGDLNGNTTELTLNGETGDGTAFMVSDQILVGDGEGPDLVVSSLTHAPEEPTSAEPITLTAVVTNIGDANAAASELSFKVGGETFPPVYAIPALAPGASFTVERIVDSLIPQNYLNTATADVNNAVAESNEDNNVTTDSYTVTDPLLPDLIIQSAEVTSINETRIDYCYVITNIGEGPANLDGPTDENFDNVSVQAFLSNDEIFNNAGDVSAGGSILGVSPLGDLNPGETIEDCFGSTPSSNPLDFAFITFQVDWGQQVGESNEDNNTFAEPIN